MKMGKMFQLLKKASWEHWGDAGLSLVCALIGGCLPFWGGLLICFMVKHEWTFVDKFMAHGEFVLYAAAFLSTSLFLTLRLIVYSKLILAWMTVFIITSMLACVLVFSAVLVRDVPQAGVQLDIAVIAWLSAILFTIALLLNGVFALVSNVLEGFDFAKVEAAMEKTFDKRFDELQ